MLSNAYFLAKFRFDTAENEPAKNLLIFPILLSLTPNPLTRGVRSRGRRRHGAVPGVPGLPRAARRGRRARGRASVGKISAECCSFSAVSAPIFARKYAFCSIFQNLPDSQADIFKI